MQYYYAIEKNGTVEHFNVFTSNAEIAFAKAFEHFSNVNGEMLYGPHESKSAVDAEIAELEHEKFIADYSCEVIRG